MARSWQLRGIFLLFVFTALLGSSVSYAQELDAERSGSQWDKTPALEIIDKQFNEETGFLTVMLRNRSDLAVTAFGLSYVEGGDRATQSKDIYMQGGIAPGASYAIEISLRDLGEASSSDFTDLTARSVRLDHEIRSDNTGYGSTKKIERWFELRTAHFVEYEAALARLREATSGLPKSVRPLLEESTEDGQAARTFLLDPYSGEDQREWSRLGAIASVADMTEQAERSIATGRQSEQEAIVFLKQYFEKEVAMLAKNIRPIDLERYER